MEIEELAWKKLDKISENEKLSYTYLLKCADDTYYCGWSSDLKKRVAAHNNKKGAKYTRTRTPVRLVYFEYFDNRVDAMRREYQIKKLTKKQKEELINDSFV